MPYVTSFERLAMEEGREEGREEGEYVGRIHAFEELLNRPLTPREELRQLSVGELRQRAEALQEELRNKG